MTTTQTREERARLGGEADALHATIVGRLLAHGQTRTHEVLDQPAGRRTRAVDRRGDVADRGAGVLGEVVHRDELRERELAAPELAQRREQEVRRVRRPAFVSRHFPESSVALQIYALPQ